MRHGLLNLDDVEGVMMWGRPRALLLMVFSFLISGPFLFAQAKSEMFLLPFNLAEPRSGAKGSVWMTELWAHNPSDDWVRIHPGHPACRTTCPGATVPPGTSAQIPLYSHHAENLFVAEGSGISWSLRVRDLSRQAETGGTEVPSSSTMSPHRLLLVSRTRPDFSPQNSRDS